MVGSIICMRILGKSVQSVLNKTNASIRKNLLEPGRRIHSEILCECSVSATTFSFR